MPAYDALTELREPSRVPSRLGKYEMRQPVGNGASGTVYDAWDPDLARRVAIKQVRLQGRTEAEQQELRARFRQEAQIAGRLSHPGVVSVYDYGEQDDSAYLVMEFVDGESLATLLQSTRQRQETMAPERAVQIMLAMLAALGACHRAGVLHRDIKPGNVMLSRSGAVKLTDFGIARSEVSDLTAQGTLIGTPTYMSPEQFESRAPVDARSDLYGCGVVLYELLTGRKPFEGDLFAVMHQVRTELPVPPSRAGAAVSPALDAVVLRAMAKQPADRFANADAFAAALLQSMAATPPPLWRRRVGLALAGLVGIAAIGGAVWYSYLDLRRSAVLPDHPRQAGGQVVDDGASPAPAAPPPAAAALLPQQQAGDVPAAPAADSGPPGLDPRLLPTLGQLPCANVIATLQRNPLRLSLRGLLSEDAARETLPPLLAGYKGTVDRRELQEFPASGALCQVAELVHVTGPNLLRLALAGGRTRLVAGEAIRLSLQMPDFGGEVRLDYITDGGRSVVHLDPAGADGRRWQAGERITPGPAGDGVIGSVGEPYGVDMVLVTVAEQPLLPTSHPGQESAEAYLRALQAAIEQATQQGRRVAADALVLETAAR